MIIKSPSKNPTPTKTRAANTVTSERRNKWRDPNTWAKLCSGEICVICRRGQPRDLAAALETSWLTIKKRRPCAATAAWYFGVTPSSCTISPRPKPAPYIRDLQRVSRTVKEVTSAVKINCEIHGSSLPHLHIHFSPRRSGGWLDGGPIDGTMPKARPMSQEAAGEFAAYAAAIRAALGVTA